MSEPASCVVLECSVFLAFCRRKICNTCPEEPGEFFFLRLFGNSLGGLAFLPLKPFGGLMRDPATLFSSTCLIEP